MDDMDYRMTSINNRWEDLKGAIELAKASAEPLQKVALSQAMAYQEAFKYELEQLKKTFKE